jgi:hypothetical protein
MDHEADVIIRLREEEGLRGLIGPSQVWGEA